MPKNRIIYQNEVLYVGPSPSTGIQNDDNSIIYSGLSPRPLTRQLFRIQSINYGYSLNRRDVNQFGELAAIDRILLESPTVNLDFSYLNSNFYNEQMLGFLVASGHGQTQSCISHILNKSQDDKNYFIKTVPEGIDAINHGENNSSQYSKISFISIGNCSVSNFSTEGSVGDFPRSNISLEALNCQFQTPKPFNNAGFGHYEAGEGFSGVYFIDNPAVNPSNGQPVNTSSSNDNQKFVCIPVAVTNPWSGYHFRQDTTTGPNNVPNSSQFNSPYSISALRPGDITLKILQAGSSSLQQELGASISDAKIQSYNLNFSLSRDPLQKLGSKYAFSKEIRFPVQVNLSLEANVGDLTTGNLVDAISADRNYDIEINIAHPQTGNFTLMKYILKNSKLDSQSYTSSIGPNKNVTLNFSSQIGGPLQIDRGLFMSGYLPNVGPVLVA